MTRHFIAASIIAVVLSACGGGHDDAQPAPTVVAHEQTAAAPAPSTAAARPPEIKPAQAVAPEPAPAPAPAASPVVAPSLHAPMYSSCEIVQGQRLCRHTNSIPTDIEIGMPRPPWAVSVGQSVLNESAGAGAIVVRREPFGEQGPEREIAYAFTVDGVNWTPWRFTVIDDANPLSVKAMPTQVFIDADQSLIVLGDEMQWGPLPPERVWLYRAQRTGEITGAQVTSRPVTAARS